MELGDALGAVRKRWYIVVLFVILGSFVGFAQANGTTPSYRATAQVFVAPTGSDNVNDLVQATNYIERLAQSFADLADTPAVLDPVAEQLGLALDGQALTSHVSASLSTDTYIISISATADDAKLAADIANATAGQLAVSVSELSSGGTDAALHLSTVAPAVAPGGPFEPKTKLLIAVGTVGGIFLGVCAALILAGIDTRLRTADDVSAVTGGPVIAAVPRTAQGERPTMLDKPLSAAAEAYRRLYTNLLHADVTAPVRSVLVTSALSREGKSTTVLNLALAATEKGRRVLVIDADLRRPSIAPLLGLAESDGLTGVIGGGTELASAVQKWRPGVDVLTAGPTAPGATRFADSASMRAIIRDASQTYDLVIVDTPPVLPVADASALASAVDGTLLVAGCRRIRRPDFVDAIKALQAVNAVIVGVVAHGVPADRRTLKYADDDITPAAHADVPTSRTSRRTDSTPGPSVTRP